MTAALLLLIVIALAIAGYALGRRRAVASAAGDARKLHSLPAFHGQSVALFTAVPALLVMAVWMLAEPQVVRSQVADLVTVEGDDAATKLRIADMDRLSRGIDALIARSALTEADIAAMRADLSDVRGRFAEVGVALGAEVDPAVFEAAKESRSITRTSRLALTIVTLGLALGGLGLALARITPAFRARNVTEAFMRMLLVAAAGIAILTTVGIVMSMLSESLRFFALYPAPDFFFGLTWNPQFRGGSELGLLPLLWGTLYITLVAMVVAVPIGIFAAIYTAEFASPRVRSVVKPLIEVIAGIPTVVFGLFALVTVGPFLRDYFAQPLGLGNSGSSVMTAGIVIGILNIPFISSLADDIINAVPQSMRDGSLGLGATRAETIRQVVLPAALPGIVGAVLLATSRAIGETMIVTMGAGAAARLDLNPFQAMTTITVKIVSQLTGDTEFNSPETLVAFALGITLFVITLGLNVFAIWIVRRYREQYE